MSEEQKESTEAAPEVQKAPTVVIAKTESVQLTPETYKGESYIVEYGGVLTLRNGVDPNISSIYGRVDYVGIDGQMSDIQKANVSKWRTGVVGFNRCRQKKLALSAYNTDMDDCNYEEVTFGHVPVERDYLSINHERNYLYLRNGTAIRSLETGPTSVLYVNTADEQDSEAALVFINDLVIHGQGELELSRIDRLTVERAANVSIGNTKIDELDVFGTVFISHVAYTEIGTIRLHSGGRIFGDIEGLNIVGSNRPIQIKKSGSTIWMFG